MKWHMERNMKTGLIEGFVQIVRRGSLRAYCIRIMCWGMFCKTSKEGIVDDIVDFSGFYNITPI